MNYESLDWELEAKRVSQAFGIEGEFRARLVEEPDGSKLLFKKSAAELENDPYKGRLINVEADFWIGCYYGPDERAFRVTQNINGKQQALTDVHLNWDGTNFHATGTRINIDGHWILAKGLYHLDLLTPELESSLKIAVSNHQKLEWTLEYEKRNEL